MTREANIVCSTPPLVEVECHASHTPAFKSLILVESTNTTASLVKLNRIWPLEPLFNCAVTVSGKLLPNACAT